MSTDSCAQSVSTIRVPTLSKTFFTTSPWRCFMFKRGAPAFPPLSVKNIERSTFAKTTP